MRVASNFYLGQNEDYSPGDSISESSEELLQRGSGGGGQYRCDFAEGGVHALEHICFAEVSARLVKVTAGHEEQTSP